LRALFTLVFLLTPGTTRPDHPVRDWPLNPQPLLRLDTMGDLPLFVPSIAAISPQGYWIIHDWKRHENFILDPQGNLVSRFGRKGEGPGEVLWQEQVVFNRDIRILDSARNAIHIFSSQGRYLKTHVFPPGFPHIQHMTGDRSCLAWPDTPPLTLTLVSLPSNSRTLITELAEESGIRLEQTLDSGKRMAIIIPGITPRVLVAADPHSGSFFFGNASRPLISRMTPLGVVDRRIPLPRPVIPVTGAMLQELYKEIPLPESMRRQLRRAHLNACSHLEIVDDLLVVYGAGFGDDWPCLELDFFSRGGQHLGHSIFWPPEGSRLHSTPNYPPLLRRGCLYVALEDTFGDYSLVRYQVDLPPAP